MTEKRALVTGAANGLGKAMLIHLVEHGFHVVAADHDLPGLKRLKKAGGKQVTTLPMDLAIRDSLESNTGKICEHGPYDLVFLVAGISATGRFEKIPVSAHLRVQAINLLAPLAIAAGLASRKAMTGNSGLVFVSSLSRVLGYPGAASYAASKDGIAIYAKSIRKPFARLGIRVCCAYPGPVRTDHAERHAPPDANADRRMPPNVAARKIIQAAMRGRANIYPGLFGKIALVAGRISPSWITGKMRQQVFEKLDGEVF